MGTFLAIVYVIIRIVILIGLAYFAYREVRRYRDKNKKRENSNGEFTEKSN